MALFQLEPDLPALADPVVVAALDGWVDAVGAASAAVELIAGDGPAIVRFDGDEIFDYRSRRPVLDVVDGVLSELTWPELTIRHARAGGRDLLVLAGAEPDARWPTLAADMVEVVRRLGVVQWISLGAVPGAVPHTRPVPVMATASRGGLLTAGHVPGPEGQLRVPAAALSAFEMAVTASGVPAVGFFAQVPPYVASGYAAASVALLDNLAGHLGVTFDVRELTAEAGRERARYDAAVASDPEMQEMITRLEAMAGETTSALERLPTGDELASEIERFLRDRSTEDPGPPFGDA
jgi:hypothetical protein